MSATICVVKPFQDALSRLSVLLREAVLCEGVDDVLVLAARNKEGFNVPPAQKQECGNETKILRLLTIKEASCPPLATS